MKVSHRTGNKSPSSAGPSIWWLLGMALAAVVMVWGSYELVQEASLQPVVLLAVGGGWPALDGDASAVVASAATGHPSGRDLCPAGGRLGLYPAACWMPC